MNNVKCEVEFGYWTIRINGMFIQSFWYSATALEVYTNLLKSLDNLNPLPYNEGLKEKE